VILDSKADEFVRARMFSALAMLTRSNLLSREETKRFLVACNEQLVPRKACYAWTGWQEAIAALGFAELKPLVVRAFADQRIDRFWMELGHFESDLRAALDDPSLPPPRSRDGDYELFGDTIETFSDWHGFASETAGANAPPLEGTRLVLNQQVPAANPFKGVGRNDPCPCGSDKKFKRCCLERQATNMSEASFN
jgi:hypothetical protein